MPSSELLKKYRATTDWLQGYIEAYHPNFTYEIVDISDNPPVMTIEVPPRFKDQLETINKKLQKTYNAAKQSNTAQRQSNSELPSLHKISFKTCCPPPKTNMLPPQQQQYYPPSPQPYYPPSPQITPATTITAPASPKRSSNTQETKLEKFFQEQKARLLEQKNGFFAWLFSWFNSDWDKKVDDKIETLEILVHDIRGIEDTSSATEVNEIINCFKDPKPSECTNYPSIPGYCKTINEHRRGFMGNTRTYNDLLDTLDEIKADRNKKTKTIN